MNITIYKTQDGKEVELREFVNAPSMVSVNGVIQQPGTYKIVGKSVFFDWSQNPCWKPWFAWRPVKDIHGVWHWWETVYRKSSNTYVNHDDWKRYHYGTIFDALKD